MKKIDNINGLLYTGIQWIGSIGLLSKPELLELESELKLQAARHSAEDSLALRCFANAVHAYISTHEETH